MTGLLLVELRTGGGTLEERYLELIGSEAAEDGDEDVPSATARSSKDGKDCYSPRDFRPKERSRSHR